ncbi:MAG: LacI family DNA-binding transcriptional regulator [Ilumatobacter sp.]|uniref:LacI family DNA-binding transcriptional regulator n=1 Tax=Ilumatobacter sp. TaxID=1967498 RepID=UPI002612017A|nr:LacI family DNA-binding transcriptional regulator [Ilumatobacter sp.]MDJ0770519.1 LacI family DNA-binding transcriptional regulator [Ilumatobacter sp.]
MVASSQNLTLEEIGKRAGVSRSTVSRVLNDHPDVRPAVRERVEAVIAETGYHPNQAARALVSNRSGLIGLVMLTEVDELFGDPYYSALVTGIQQGCLDHNLTFSIFPVLGTGRRADVVTGQIAQGFVDGVIVTAGPRSEQAITTLRDRGTRLVVVGHPVHDDGLMRVDVENRVGGAAAATHLIGHGRQRVGFVGPTSDFVFGVERLEGYREALRAAGRDPSDRWVRLDQPNPAGGYRAALALLHEEPDAIFAATDPMAEGVFRALAERGVRIPDDVAVVGFDGLPRRPKIDPPLTTVVQPVGDVGRTAVDMLAGEAQAPHLVLLPTHLHIGSSCGADDALHGAG